MSTSITEPPKDLLLRLCLSGPTPTQLVESAKANGINRPVPLLRELHAEGLIRVDKGIGDKPDRIKPTRKAQGLSDLPR